MVKNNKTYMKHFPSDPTIYKDKMTFLTDKKVDAELYALLVQFSYGMKDEGSKGETRVYKDSIPT